MIFAMKQEKKNLKKKFLVFYIQTKTQLNLGKD